MHFSTDQMSIMFTEWSMLQSMEHLACPGRGYLGDAELIARFRMAPVAMAMHHA